LFNNEAQIANLEILGNYEILSILFESTCNTEQLKCFDKTSSKAKSYCWKSKELLFKNKAKSYCL